MSVEMRVFPARAGMSPQIAHDYDMAWRFPRTRGDEPAAGALWK